MFKETGNSTIQLYDCPRLSARITKQQCDANRKRAKELSIFDDRLNTVYLKQCLNCEGVVGQFAKKQKAKFADKKRCSSCRTYKDHTEFRISQRTGFRKAMCWKCDDTQIKRRQQHAAPPTPPRLSFVDKAQSKLNSAAVRELGLQEYKYFSVRQEGEERFLVAAKEKKQGFYTFNAYNQQALTKQCSARQFVQDADAVSGTQFRLEETKEPRVFRLVEE